MLHRSLLSAITSRFFEKNRHIRNIVHGSTSSYNNLHEHFKEIKCNNSMQMEEKIKNIKLDKGEKKKQEKRGKKITVKNKKRAIIDYIQSIDLDISNACSEHFIKSLERDTNVLYLIDEETAEKYVSLIIKDLLKNTCFVAELNPGFGILTKELLKAGIPLIHLYEAKQEFHPVLEKIHNIYPGQLDIRNFNLININYLLYKDRKTDDKQVEQLLQDVENKKWEDETYMQIVGAINKPIFFRHLISSLIFHNSLMSKGRPVLYIMMPPLLWHIYTCDTSNAKIYTSLKVMFQTMFHYELLGIVDRKAFLPFPKQKKLSQTSPLTFKQIQKENYMNMYVVKLEPRPDLYSQLSQKDWIIFWYFVRYHMRKRSNRLIPDLEKWIPDCGIRLIAKNYTIFTQFGDLTPPQILEVFKEFKSWPEYEESYFLTCMADSLKSFNEPALLYHNILQTDE